MNFFCCLLGHTWVDHATTPKTSWNVGKAGVQLLAKMSGRPARFQEGVRCKLRREVPVLESSMRSDSHEGSWAASQNETRPRGKPVAAG